jgi:hypothetical protein
MLYSLILFIYFYAAMLIAGNWMASCSSAAGTSDKTTHVFQQFPILGGGIAVRVSLTSGKSKLK